MTRLELYNEICSYLRDFEKVEELTLDDRVAFLDDAIDLFYKIKKHIEEEHQLLYIGKSIEYLDVETNIIHELEVYDYDLDADMMKCCEYGLDGKVCSEWEIPISSWLYQRISGMVKE
jgi:hypothetical protein